MAAVYLAPTLGAGWQGFTTGGLPLNAGQILTYAAGTSTPVATFTTSAGNVANSNPIVLGADGRPPSEIWLQSGQAYKFVLEDSGSNVIATYDNLTGIGDPLASFIAGNSPALDNILINGSFPVDQRNVGASVNVPASGFAYTVDRWVTTCTSGGSLNAQRVNTDTGGGSQYALAFSVSTAKSSLVAADAFNTVQKVEGLNVQHLAWGTSNAQPVTLQFRLKTSIPSATLPVSILNGAVNRSYVTTVTTGAANTEVVYSVTIPGDTAGTWPIDNTASLLLVFGWGIGSTSQTGSPNTWQAGNFQGTASCTNFMSSLSNTWQITDVTLVAGSVALPVQRRSFAAELALCQRYFEKSYDYGTALASVTTTGATQIFLTPLASAGWGSGAQVYYKVSKRSSATAPVIYSTGTGTTGKMRDVTNSADVTANVNDQGMGGFFPSATMSLAGTTLNLTFQWSSDQDL